SHHCIKVLRHQKNDLIHIVNGKGNIFYGIIIDGNAKKCLVKVQTKDTFTHTPPFVHIVISPTKQMERIEWFVEKAAELGVDKITFMECKNSVRDTIKLERLEKITISALKQSKNFIKTDIYPLDSFVSCIQNKKKDEIAYIATANESMQNHILKKIGAIENQKIFIGPEGDFTKEELEEARKEGIIPVSLGQNILRTETAGIVSASILKNNLLFL
ncbi:MAG: RsmE family RNA methyltransferase, partial [Chitinophagaceae bacterium]|nr:RsmE family RNA methyltransferase [Chitinophagaceae bacterium]